MVVFGNEPVAMAEDLFQCVIKPAVQILVFAIDAERHVVLRECFSDIPVRRIGYRHDAAVIVRVPAGIKQRCDLFHVVR